MKLFNKWALKLTVLVIILNFCTVVGKSENKSAIHRGIHKRGLFYPVLLYPYNACTGILVAIAIPLALPGRNVFLSYNFEGNYNMPNQPGDSGEKLFSTINYVNFETERRKVNPSVIKPNIFNRQPFNNIMIGRKRGLKSFEYSMAYERPLTHCFKIIFF